MAGAGDFIHATCIYPGCSGDTVDDKFCIDHTSRKGGTMPAKFKKAATKATNAIGKAIEKSAKDAEKVEAKKSAKKKAAPKKKKAKKSAKKKAAKKSAKKSAKKKAAKKSAKKKAAKKGTKKKVTPQAAVSWPDVIAKFQKGKAKTTSATMGSPGSAQVTRVRLTAKYPKLHFRTEGATIHVSKVKFK